jgi:hypothetical protein
MLGSEYPVLHIHATTLYSVRGLGQWSRDAGKCFGRLLREGYKGSRTLPKMCFRPSASFDCVQSDHSWLILFRDIVSEGILRIEKYSRTQGNSKTSKCS